GEGGDKKVNSFTFYRLNARPLAVGRTIAKRQIIENPIRKSRAFFRLIPSVTAKRAYFSLRENSALFVSFLLYY
ncbi:hypothetical protein L1286_23655, partial [Pseudoalteromonas sp. SMS1]|uniref:hypothetical protein n=1 Tax=Pseudoalteromonas sp. SMS1 TaxID=2908894 RepID=UPI001F47BB76